MPESEDFSGSYHDFRRRCCPKCGSTKFLVADCDAGRKANGGFMLRCENTDCHWRGFKLQLSKVFQNGNS